MCVSSPGIHSVDGSVDWLCVEPSNSTYTKQRTSALLNPPSVPYYSVNVFIHPSLKQWIWVHAQILLFAYYIQLVNIYLHQELGLTLDRIMGWGGYCVLPSVNFGGSFPRLAAGLTIHLVPVFPSCFSATFSKGFHSLEHITETRWQFLISKNKKRGETTRASPS